MGHDFGHPGSEIDPLPSLADITPVWGCGCDESALLVDTKGVCWVASASSLYRWVPLSLGESLCDRFIFPSIGPSGWCLIPRDTGGLLYSPFGMDARHELVNINFVDCASGKGHFLAVAQDGRLFSWGRGKACGQGRRWFSAVPCAVSGFERVSRCFATFRGSFVIDFVGTVFVAGRFLGGRLGWGSERSWATFQAGLHFPAPVVHIAHHTGKTFFLLETGQLFACGMRMDNQFANWSEYNPFIPFEIEVCGEHRFSWVSVSRSQCMVQTGSGEILKHPCKRPQRQVEDRSFLVQIGADQRVDVSLVARLNVGCELGEECVIANQVLRFVGRLLSDSVLLINSEERTVTVSTGEFIGAVNYGQEVTRSGISQRIRAGKDDAVPFGFRIGEGVAHPDFGNGSVVGIARGKIWFRWEDDSGISTAANCEPLALSRYITITKPMGREVVRLEVGDDQEANVEVSPCEVLAASGLRVGDIVRTREGSIARVWGEFTIRAVIADVQTGHGKIVAISELTVIARPNDSLLVCAQDFAGEIVDLNLGFKDGDPIIPGDRVLTEKGMASVVAVDGNALWVQADVATRLNIGLLRYVGKVKLIRRILALREVAGIMAGDIVRVGEKRFLARVEGEELILESLGDPNEIIREERIGEVEPVLVLRPELPGSVLVNGRKGTVGLFSVNTADFKGKRIMPGDLVEILGTQFDVIGERADMVWFKPIGEIKLVTIQPQALVDTEVIKIIEFADRGLKLNGT